MASVNQYISEKTANALVSDLAPTRVSADCLSYINLILDEILFSIVDGAGSIDPHDVKLKGVPALFAAESSTTPIVSHFSAITKSHARNSSTSSNGQSSKVMLNPLKTGSSFHEAGSKSLARDAINEAELELAAWKTAAQAGSRKDAFQQDRRGLRSGFSELAFPSKEAADFLRSRVAAYSSLADYTPDAQKDKILLRSWSTAGGSTAPDIVTPASLYLTAIIEYICERILADLGKVAMRNARSNMVETQDLYASLCEGETLWGLFKQLRVKEALEANVPANLAYEHILSTPAQATSKPSSPRTEPLQRIASSSSYSAGIVSSGSRPPSMDRPPSAYQPGSGVGQASFDGPRKLVNMASRSSMVAGQTSESTSSRPPSIHSSRTSVDISRDSFTTSRSELKTAKEEEFDALLTSGHTMKVSLTPSRLKRFDRTRVNTAPPVATAKIPPTGSPLGRHSSTFSRSNSTRLKKGAVSPTVSPEKSRSPKLVPRDGESSEEERSDNPGPDMGIAPKPTLNEVLRSDPPWGEQAKVSSPPQLRVKPQIKNGADQNRIPVLGRPVAITPEGSSRPAESSESTFGPRKTSVGQPSISVDGQGELGRRSSQDAPVNEDGNVVPKNAPRKRSSAADLADFFRNTSPPSSNPRENMNPEPLLIPARKSDTAELADFFKNTSPPVGNASLSSKPKPNRIRSMIAKVIHKGQDTVSVDRASTANTGGRMESRTEWTDTIAQGDVPTNSDRPTDPAPVEGVVLPSRLDEGAPGVTATDAILPVTDVGSDRHLRSTIPRPSTLSQHQVLVFDISSESDADGTELAMVGSLKDILSPFYTVGTITGKALRREPWERTCALLIILSTESALSVGTDAILRERISSYSRAGGKIWSVGPATALLCRVADLSERKMLEDDLLFPGTMARTSNELPSGICPSSLVVDGDAGQRGDISVLERDPDDRIVALGWASASGKCVAWTTDLARSSEGDVKTTIRYYKVALAFLDVHQLEPVNVAQSRWEAIDPTLLKPTRPLPVMLLSHPELASDLPAQIIGLPEIDANSTEAQVDLQDQQVTVKALRDTGDTFHVIDIASIELVVPRYMQAQRLIEASEADPSEQKSISLLLGKHEDWRPEWTPLFDFARYWSELDSTARRQGVGRKRKLGGGPDGLGSWSLGDVIQYGEAVGSTQTMLDRNPILLYGLPLPYVSMASFQLAGRGRGKNQWLSPAGCLQFSILLKLPRGFPSNKVVFAQYIAALAICQGLDDDGKLGVRIKWPNDIYAEAEGLGQAPATVEAEKIIDGERRTPSKGRAKLGGILVNSSFVKGEWHLVVGCGINILNDLPTTSLAQLYELAHKRNRTAGPLTVPTMEGSLARILVAFEEIWDKFVEEKGFAGFIDEYTGRWLHTDQPVTLTTVKPHLPLIIKTLELNSGLLRCVPATSEGGPRGSSSYDAYEDRYSTSVARPSDRYVDLQPDGNSFDLMSGLIKQKI